MTMDNPQPKQQAHEPSGGRPVIVDVFADLNSTGGVCFSHEWRFENGSKEGDGRIDIPKGSPNDPGTPIHFHLHDRSGRKLRYDEADPIWVKRSECPAESSEDCEIPRNSIEARPKHLTVMDINTEECELHYNLRFKDDDGRVEEYDPSIRNGGR